MNTQSTTKTRKLGTVLLLMSMVGLGASAVVDFFAQSEGDIEIDQSVEDIEAHVQDDFTSEGEEGSQQESVIAPQIGFENVHYEDVDINVVEDSNGASEELAEEIEELEHGDDYQVSDLDGVNTYAASYSVETSSGTEVIVDGYEDNVAPRIVNEDIDGGDSVHGIVWFETESAQSEDIVEVVTEEGENHDFQSFDWIKYETHVTGTDAELDDGVYRLVNPSAQSHDHVSPHQFQLDLEAGSRDHGGFYAYDEDGEPVNTEFSASFEDTFGEDAEISELQRLGVGTGTSDADADQDEMNLQYSEVAIGEESLQPVDLGDSEVNGEGEATLPEDESVLATVVKVSPFVDTGGEAVEYGFSFEPPTE